MVRLIKAYDRPEGIVFEVAVLAATEKGAKTKALASLIGRRPSKATAVSDVVVTELGSGVIKHYRVEVLFEDEKDLKSILKLDSAVNALEKLL